MPDDPSGVTPSVSSLREWDDPKIVQVAEVAKYMAEGWEPMNALMVPATNQATGEQTVVVCYCIRRKFSPVRDALAVSPIHRLRLGDRVLNLPRANGKR